MSLPPDLIKLAALGTEEKHLPARNLGEAAVELLTINETPEKQLLTAIVALTLRKQVSYKPGYAEQQPFSPCKPEGKPVCSAKGAIYLKRFSEGRWTKVLPEYLKEIIQQEKRIPEEMLPLLIELGFAQRSLRELIKKVIGERGYWLAQVITTKASVWLHLHKPERTWANGSIEARAEMLYVLRQAQPDQARELIISTWEQESPAARIAFLTELDMNLSMADEPFLESILDTGEQEVREKVYRLLCKLPESGFCKRMRDRTMQVIQYDTRADKITMNYPETCTPEMQRDGLSGDPENLLKLMISYVAPQQWCNQWHIRPEKLISLIPRNDKTFLWEALTWATYRAKDARFADLLVPEACPFLTEHQIKLLLQVMSQRQIEARAIWLLETQGYSADKPVNILLAHLEDTWGYELTTTFLRHLTSYFQERNPKKITGFEDFLWYLHVTARKQLYEVLPDTPYGRMLQQKSREILTFRADMLTALRE